MPEDVKHFTTDLIGHVDPEENMARLLEGLHTNKAPGDIVREYFEDVNTEDIRNEDLGDAYDLNGEEAPSGPSVLGAWWAQWELSRRQAFKDHNIAWLKANGQLPRPTNPNQTPHLN